MVDKKNRKQYAKEQFDLGWACYKKGGLDQTIAHLTNIQLKDDEYYFYLAKVLWGMVYVKQRKLAEAIEYFENVPLENYEVIYAIAQVRLGILYYKNTDELDNAIKHLKNVKKTYSKIVYSNTQFHLGKVYYKKDELDDSKKYMDEVLDQQEKNILKASIFSDKIAILQAYAKGKNREDYIHFKQGLDNLDDDVDEILKSLIVSFEEGQPERKVATYTTVRVAKLFIDKKEKSFHLNIANRMNDTTEGQNLFKWMGYAENTETTNTIYGFLTSFTFNHNSLNQFRLYGKTEDKEGTGVSFVVSTDIFSDTHSDNYIEYGDTRMVDVMIDAASKDTQNEDKNLITKKIPLYRCIYINPDNGYVSLARRSRYSFFLEHGDLDEAENADKQTAYNEYKEKIDEAENEVKARLRNIKANYEKVSVLADKKQLRQQTDQLIRKILLPLCFLTKHASFEEEAECRIIYITDIANEKVTFEDNRFFVAYGVPVLDRQSNKSYLNKIYLGPKVDEVVKIELQHLYYQQGIKAPIRIEKSNLPLA